MNLALLVAMPGLFIWLAILFLPWRPWSIRETLDADSVFLSLDLSNVTVLIPARNEAETIQQTLTSLKAQGQNLNIILVDDQSSDNTIEKALSVDCENLQIIQGKPLEAGWCGKLWALEQGRQNISTKYILLLDADITLKPSLISTVLKKVTEENLQMLSLMAFLKMETSWERFLMPAFIFFFKLLYPFNLANRHGNSFSAAAGSFILLENKVLKELGGFTCIKNALIDDCSLAAQIKKAGYRCWTGLTHSAKSIRSYDDLKTIWKMVTRTAYTQLFYSPLLLILCTILMFVAFILPLYILFTSTGTIMFIASITLLIQFLCYLPTINYYSLPLYLVITLPLAGALYLIMTWHSAYEYYFASGATWKDRNYQ